jgi:hypothetical protein
MSVPYVPSSMKWSDKKGGKIADQLQFILLNKVDSGSANIGVKLLIDGVDYTDRATIRIEDQQPQKLGPYVYVSTGYGDKCFIEVDHGGKVKPGKHKVKVIVDTPVGSYTTEFEDKA